MEGKPEPTGVGLKAAYLLLEELRRYPKLPSMEEMAILLENVLNYEWAVRLIRIASDWCGSGLSRSLGEFNEWADNMLVGPDFRDTAGPQMDPETGYEPPPKQIEGTT